MHRPASVLDATPAEDSGGGEALSAQDEVRLSRVSRRLHAHVRVRRTPGANADLGPISGEFDI